MKNKVYRVTFNQWNKKDGDIQGICARTVVAKGAATAVERATRLVRYKNKHEYYVHTVEHIATLD